MTFDLGTVEFSFVHYIYLSFKNALRKPKWHYSLGDYNMMKGIL